MGDIVNFDKKIKALDLLNESIDIDTSFQLNKLAKEAVRFLKLDKVVAKMPVSGYLILKFTILRPSKIFKKTT